MKSTRVTASELRDPGLRGLRLRHQGFSPQGGAAAHSASIQRSPWALQRNSAPPGRSVFTGATWRRPQQASGLFFSEWSATAHEDGPCRETSCPIQCAAHSSWPSDTETTRRRLTQFQRRRPRAPKTTYTVSTPVSAPGTVFDDDLSASVNPSQVPHHGRSCFAPWAHGYFTAVNLRSRGRN